MRQPYPDDLTDTEWAQIEPIVLKRSYRGAGTTPKHSRREMLNAVFYILRTGCRWRDQPHDFPPWKTVCSQFLRWKQKRIFIQCINNLKADTPPFQKELSKSDKTDVEKDRLSIKIQLSFGCFFQH